MPPRSNFTLLLLVSAGDHRTRGSPQHKLWGLIDRRNQSLLSLLLRRANFSTALTVPRNNKGEPTMSAGSSGREYNESKCRYDRTRVSTRTRRPTTPDCARAPPFLARSVSSPPPPLSTALRSSPLSIQPRSLAPTLSVPSAPLFQYFSYAFRATERDFLIPDALPVRWPRVLRVSNHCSPSYASLKKFYASFCRSVLAAFALRCNLHFPILLGVFIFLWQSLFRCIHFLLTAFSLSGPFLRTLFLVVLQPDHHGRMRSALHSRLRSADALSVPSVLPLCIVLVRFKTIEVSVIWRELPSRPTHADWEHAMSTLPGGWRHAFPSLFRYRRRSYDRAGVNSSFWRKIQLSVHSTILA